MADVYFWDFGDGNTSTSSNPTHNFKYSGEYTVSLTINGEAADTTTITAMPSFTVNTTEGEVPLAVNFTLIGAHPTATVLWDFGDGNTSGTRNPSHEYVTGGTFTVTLTVDTLQVIEPDLITATLFPADFTVDPLSGTAPSTVYFEATGTHFNDDVYAWDFGDGGTSDQPSGFHTYDWGGDYTVTLTGTQGLTPYEVTKQFYVGLDQPAMTSDGWSLTDKAMGAQKQFTYSNFDRTITTSRLGTTGTLRSLVRDVVPITSGKKYFEIRMDYQESSGEFYAGIMGSGALPSNGDWLNLTDQVLIRSNGQVFKNGSSVYYGAFGIPPTFQIENGYTIGFAVDMTTKNVTIYVENTSLITVPFDPSVIYPFAGTGDIFDLEYTVFLSEASQKYAPPTGYTSVIPGNPQPFVSGTLDATVTQYWTADFLTADSNFSTLTWDGIRYTGPGDLVSSYQPTKATVQFGYLDANITGTTGVSGAYEPSVALSNSSNQQLIFGSRVLTGVQNIYLEYSDNGDVTSLITAPTTTASGATEYTLNDDGITCEIYNGLTQVHTGASVLKRLPPGLFFALGLSLPNNEKVTLANIRLEP